MMNAHLPSVIQKKGRFVVKALQKVRLKSLFLAVLVTFVYVGFEGEICSVQFPFFAVGIIGIFG